MNTNIADEHWLMNTSIVDVHWLMNSNIWENKQDKRCSPLSEHGLIASFIKQYSLYGKAVYSKFWHFPRKWNAFTGLCFCHQTPLKCQNILQAVFRDLGIRLDRFLLNKFPSVDSEAHSYSSGSKECARHLKISKSYRNKKSLAKYWQHQRAIDHYFVEHN